MLTRIDSLKLGLLISGSVLLPMSASAQERTQITLRGMQGDVKGIAKLMQSQAAGAHLRIAVERPPDLKRLLTFLPHGAHRTGDLIVLPNGSDFELVKAKTLAQERAEFEKHTETRPELIERLKQLKDYAANVKVKVKRPHEKTFTAVGSLDEGILEVPYLPTGTYTIAVVPGTKVSYQFYRIAGQPEFPQAHTGMNPGMRWTQKAPRGRWEEEPTKTETGLHWIQRTDGYWEEAPIKK